MKEMKRGFLGEHCTNGEPKTERKIHKEIMLMSILRVIFILAVSIDVPIMTTYLPFNSFLTFK